MDNESGYESGSEHSLPSSESQGTSNHSGSEQSLPSSTSQGSEESLPTSTSQGTKSESGSEESLPTSTSQGTSSNDSQKNKKQRRCDVCKNYVDEDSMMSWTRSNETGAELYYQSYSGSAPDRWTCADCNNSNLDIKYSTGSGSDTSRTSQVQGPNNQAASSSRTNQVQQSDDSCNEISATNPPSQTHSRPAVEEASPPTKKQKTSDNDAPSDSESAK